jgi:BlaI family penicillinase repressor
MKPPSGSLGKIELELLQAVSRLQPVTVRGVVDHVADKTGQARTTILTTLERLRKKGYLSRRKIDGVNHYSTKTPVAELLRQLVGDFVSQVLGGSISPFAAYLAEAGKVSPDEVKQLKAMVSDLESRQKSAPKTDEQGDKS